MKTRRTLAAISALIFAFIVPALADDILLTPAKQEDTVRIFASGKKVESTLEITIDSEV